MEPEPVLVRAYHDGHTGATGFFRNRPFLQTLAELLDDRGTGRCRVLCHACSIGAEPYSLAMWCAHNARPLSRRLDIVATDADPQFLASARQGVYPATLLPGMTDQERGWFEPHPEGLQVPEAIRRTVRFLPPTSFVDGEVNGAFDAVLIMNALTYVTPAAQRQAIRRASTCSQRILGLTAFHPDSIMSDIASAGFKPWLRRQREIHNAWGDRLTDQPIVRGTPQYSWQLPPFDPAVPESEYRYCSLFTKAGSGPP